MVNFSKQLALLLTSTSTVLLASNSSAQNAATSGDVISSEALQIEKSVISDFQKAEDPYRFIGYSEDATLYTSLAARFALATGNQDSLDYGVSLRSSFSALGFQHSLRLAYDYARVDDVISKDRQLFSYELGRDFSEKTYAFFEARGRLDEKAAYDRDLFLGAGIGGRLVNGVKTTWRAQLGLGYRQLHENQGETFEETAALLSSRFFHEVSPDIILTNDTDVLFSDTDTLLSNDLGANWIISGPLSVRYSVLTDYRTEVQDGFEAVDWSQGLSLIYTF